MARSKVDFPAPLVPSRATISPSLHLQVDAEEHLHLVVGDVDAAAREQGGRCSGPLTLEGFGNVAAHELFGRDLDRATNGDGNSQHDHRRSLAVGVADGADDGREEDRPRQ